MKRIIFILCVFIVFVTAAYAGELYKCVDRNGNSIITDSPQDESDCSIKDSDEASSSKKNIKSQSETGKHYKRGSNSQCDSVSSNMNDARTYLNKAASRKSSELEEGKEDVKQALNFLLEAQRMSSYCPCPSLGEEIYSAAQYASSAVNEDSVSRFSDLLTRAIQAFNKSLEAFNRCR
jgi:hypothetical protein